VDAIPTAFDLDKVVAELEEYSKVCAGFEFCKERNRKELCDGRNCFECVMSDAIEIVRNGGKE